MYPRLLVCAFALSIGNKCSSSCLKRILFKSAADIYLRRQFKCLQLLFALAIESNCKHSEVSLTDFCPGKFTYTYPDVLRFFSFFNSFHLRTTVLLQLCAYAFIPFAYPRFERQKPEKSKFSVEFCRYLELSKK